MHALPGNVLAVGNDDGRPPRQLVQHRRDRFGERGIDDQRTRAAVGQNVGVLRLRQIDIERDRDAAGADRAPEGHRIVDGVVEQQRDALLVARCRASRNALAKRIERACSSP